MKMRVIVTLICVGILQLFTVISYGQSPYIVVNPTNYIFSSAEGAALPVAQSFTISNYDGSSTLNWSIQDDATWLDEDPTEGVGNFQEVALSVNTTNLPPDIYNSTVMITSNAGNGTQFVNVMYVVVSSGSCDAYGDANCDGAINVGDAVHLINYIFKNGPEPGCP